MKNRFLYIMIIPIILTILFSTLALTKTIDKNIGVGLSLISLSFVNISLGLWMRDLEKNNYKTYFFSAFIILILGLATILAL